jgi:uncharacterized protein YgiM (DUF1202 family)
MFLNRSQSAVRLIALLVFTAGWLPLAACSRDESSGQTAVVVPERLELRSTTAKVSRVVAELRGGDRVMVVERVEDGGNNWAKVRGSDGQTGWVEVRHLVSQEIVDGSRHIAEEIRQTQAQAIGRSKATLKLRLTPDRSTEENVITSLPSGAALEIVDRERRPRPASSDAKSATQPVADVKDAEPPSTKYDEWYKVRVKDNALLPAGWIYAGSVELEVPGEISYYASSGRKIVGWQKIGTARDANGRAGDHYLVLERWALLSDDKGDFSRIQVMAYDPTSRDYYVPFREDVRGRLPVTLKMEGSRGTFQVQALDKDGQAHPVNYSIEMLEGGKLRVAKVVPKDQARGKRKK